MHRGPAAGKMHFTVGGALGRHTARILSKSRAVIAETSFTVDCSTELKDEGGIYSSLLKSVLWTMMSWSCRPTTANGRPSS